jgi:hemerythrin superfamily protein
MKVTIELMEEHLIQPTKVQTMIQAFMATLTRDMKTLTDNSTSHTTSLEELLYRRVISIEGQYQVWATYVRDKDT